MDRVRRVTSGDTQGISAYTAGPEDAAFGMVIVQEIFGVNAHIRSVVDRYAEAGYRATAPAIFDRIEPGVELDYDEDGLKRGIELATSLDTSQTLADIQSALDELARPSGVVGYCYGGSMAWLAASATSARAAVGYYGGRIVDSLDDEPKIPVLLHFGERDTSIPLDDVTTIRARYPEVPVYTYDAEHGFNCDARGSYNEQAATLARQRTMDFFAEHLSAS